MMRIKSSNSAFEPKVFLGMPSDGVSLERFQKNQRVYLQGDPADTIGYVRRGALKSTVLSGRGREATVGICREGQFFGEEGLDSSKVRITTIAALDDCLVTFVTREAMLSTIRSEPSFCEFFLKNLLSRISRLEEDLIDQLLNPSEKRLARLLILLSTCSQEGEKAITVSFSQEALADMVGTTRSRVSVFMNKFRERGFINYDGHSGRIEVCAPLLLSMLGN